MADDLVRRFDKETLDRILQRATELQAGERDVTGSLNGDEVLALGRDVGIPERYLRQAMLEVGRVREAPEPEGWLDQVIGAASVQAERVVRGDQRAIEAALVGYLETEEVFGVLRRTDGHVIWEPIGGWQAAVRRATGSKTYMLQKAERLSATVVPLEPGLCPVVLRASLRDHRRGFIGGGAALLTAGLAGTLVLAALHAFWPVLLVPFPAALVSSWAIAKQFRPVIDRTQMGLECALDHLERGSVRASHQLPGRKSGILDTVISEIETLVAARTSRPGGSSRSKP